MCILLYSSDLSPNIVTVGIIQDEFLSPGPSTSVVSSQESTEIRSNIIVVFGQRTIDLRGNWDKELKKEDGNFQLFIDWKSTFDLTLKEQLERAITIVNVRYVDDETYDIREDFIAFVEPGQVDAKHTSREILDNFQNWGLDLENLRGQVYDGASGVVSGVKQRITEQCPNAPYKTDCNMVTAFDEANSLISLIGKKRNDKQFKQLFSRAENRLEDTSNNNICHSNVETYFNDHCLGHNNCTLPIDILSNNNCKRSPRRLKVDFECSTFWWFDKDFTVRTCSNSLAAVKCPRRYHIHIGNVKPYNDQSGCASFDRSSAKKRLIKLCDDKRQCVSDTTRDLSLFHEIFAIVSYECTGPKDPLITESKQSTSSDHELDMTTNSAGNSTAENDTLPKLSLDNDNRVKIHHHSLGQLYLCSLGWDDFDAGVLCKSFNTTWIGKATVLDNMLDLKTVPYSLQCDGLETSLFDCNYTTDVKGCNIKKVAGVICCEGTVKPEECVTNPTCNKVSAATSTLGVAVGIPVALIVVVCIIVVIAFTRRRYIRKKSDKKFSNFMSKHTDDNYFGQQDIALPQYPTNNRILYSEATSSTNTPGTEGGQVYCHPSKVTQSPYALSEEGVYDKANEKRHVVKDTAVYSRAIDTVYDSPEQQTRQERKEGTYTMC
ncbi:unnamed protein product [Mytilus coruscus]|uniref:SRCR domain-containing protein n=1 Tax=Mytilus coruscus TaxID=42192 RepID=A0A6J8DR54_MYTCO|nr:unnamed protein product [Mytilus coruscus]